MMNNNSKRPHIILKRNPERDKFIDAIKSIGFRPRMEQKNVVISTTDSNSDSSTYTQLWVKGDFEIKLTHKNVEFDGDFYDYNESEILFRNLKLKNII
jgi:hypothetical protein